MEFRTLRAFVEVVRQGGFSSAAQVIHATQSTISKAVRQLEDEIGEPLLDRIGHHAILTSAGEIVYRRAVALLADRDDLIAELADLRGLKTGVLRLGLPPVGSSTLFAPLFAEFRQRYPGIEVRLSEHGSDRLEELLRAGEIDFAGALLPTSEDFDFQLVRREPLVALLRADHPLAGEARLSMEALVATPFILFEPGFTLQRMIRDACRRAGVTPKVAVLSSQIDFMVELVVAGMGATFLPQMTAEQRARPGTKLVPLADPQTDWVMAMAWRRGAYLSGAAQAWLDLIREKHPASD
ncbi:LysR family transcriptional regulator [Antarcticimicrobium sediminis]|uniref:LysR family transcriptional regulator n=1 Tax=Antarcticimicrobium sediminis TaxID=2546227 RepID=A0A4V2Z772_9RHOB|nr:LysR family transcriptional regulator [Antarcticimicrobium sediminis]TDE35436.1 LysR family transcriptional regulator [Antarcticimicrobium sediminis]